MALSKYGNNEKYIIGFENSLVGFNSLKNVTNLIYFKTNKNFNLETKISYAQDKMHYLSNFNNNIINISSPNNKNTNFNLNSKTLLKPFYFDGELQINDKKAEKIIDTILLKLLNYEDIFLGNFNGVLKIKFNEIKNKLIKEGEIDLSDPNVIYLKNVFFLEHSKFNRNVPVCVRVYLCLYVDAIRFKWFHHDF